MNHFADVAETNPNKAKTNLVLSVVEWANFLPPCLECLVL